MTYSTLAEIKAANHRTGGFWFSPDTMRFFETELVDVVYGGSWFVYSNTIRYSDGTGQTFWKVAHALPNGEVAGDSIPLSKDRDESREAAEAWALDLEAGRKTCDCYRCSDTNTGLTRMRNRSSRRTV